MGTNPSEVRQAERTYWCPWHPTTALVGGEFMYCPTCWGEPAKASATDEKELPDAR